MRQKYDDIIEKITKWKKGCKQMIQSRVMMTLKVPKTVFLKTIGQLTDPEKRKAYETSAAATRVEIGEGVGQTLPKEKVIEGVKFMEAEKLKIAEVSMQMISSKKVPIHIIFRMMKNTNVMTGDRLFKEKGIDVSDLLYTMKENNMKDDADVKAILEEYKVKREKFNEGQNAEDLNKIRAMMKRALKKKGVKIQGTQDPEDKNDDTDGTSAAAAGGTNA
jgi:hypothetical protein